ncbi:MAG: hypothetical protein SFU55_09425 [Methylophilus sp.]|nr:hypothetical protein [Methylophilus sp.]
MNNIEIASLMVCGLPRHFGERLILSCYHGVWESVKYLPSEIKTYFTDDVGNEDVSYGGLLQITNTKAFELLNKLGLYTCFRGVAKEYINQVNVFPPKEFYQTLISELKFVGWDIATGNGWCTASAEGVFPINPFTGDILDDNISQLNEYGLFYSLNDCEKYCQVNNEKIPEDSPWYPVAVYVDSCSYQRLSSYLAAQKLEES